MALAKTYTVAFLGMTGAKIEVQVQITPGMHNFNIVGLADKAVAESRERIRAALHSLGMGLPFERIIVNLAPADLPKEGVHYDLPIAIALLTAMKIIPKSRAALLLSMGELGLDSKVEKVNGVLMGAMLANQNDLEFICPLGNGPEAALAGDNPIYGIRNLMELIKFANGELEIPCPEAKINPNDNPYTTDWSEIKGQQLAKKAMIIAAAGKHNLLMQGSPGIGKSMLAHRLATILPELSPIEALETTILHSLAGNLKDSSLINRPPIRTPHHSASLVSLVGGGSRAKPGEISLAHNGVLFLDEMPEFAKSALDALRQPLEEGEVHIARANSRFVYPAKFQLIAAMNPCRCGFLVDKNRCCSRAPKCGTDYQNKISGPLWDRIDLNVFVNDINIFGISDEKTETSVEIRQKVVKAREIQKQRYENLKLKINTNNQAPVSFLESLVLNEEIRNLLEKAVNKFSLSLRSYHRIFRVALTIADLEGNPKLNHLHFAEALQFRNRGDNF